jgi:catechol 2,3-dioxygenase-like lactoylglutathione lyase family enzyme
MRLRILVGACGFALSLTIAAQMPDKPIARPKITGISHLAVYASDPAATDHFYREIVGAAKMPDPENPKGVRYMINATQFVEVLPLPPDSGINRMDHTAYDTDDAEGMRKFLSVRAWKAPGAVTTGSDGSRWFDTTDPEGNKVEFVEPPPHPKAVEAPNVVGRHVIHVGILVHSRADEDTFYRDLLGFRPYWWGGMQDDKIDWVSQQTPNSRDWLEYMLTSGPSSPAIPLHMSQVTLGVLDHLSIGVNSVDAAYKQLTDGKRHDGRHDDKPKIGKDGKEQFNMYDPDGIRLELMSFHASEKPCCSAFTADDPAE